MIISIYMLLQVKIPLKNMILKPKQWCLNCLGHKGKINKIIVSPGW